VVLFGVVMFTGPRCQIPSHVEVHVRSLWLKVELIVNRFNHLCKSEVVMDIELDDPILHRFPVHVPEGWSLSSPTRNCIQERR